MTESPCAPGKVLMKDGAWIVPENERPANWREMTEKIHPDLMAVAVVEPAPVVVDVIATVAPTSVVANTGESISGMAAPTLEWAERKLAACVAERDELVTARDEAKERKWKVSALAKAALNAIARVTFYEKVRDALSAGFLLFPPVPNADCIAIRVPDGMAYPDESYDQIEGAWPRTKFSQQQAYSEPSGHGEYKSPSVSWTMVRKWQKNLDGGKTETVRDWEALALKDPEFPLVMAKPEIIQCVSAAMELKVFDEIRMFPFERRKGDPCILGTVWDKRNHKYHYFLISWLVREQDI
jgi:hypothetical protein